MLMAMKDVALSSGSACTSASLEPSYVLRALGAEDDMAHSSIRFGIGRFTTESEIDFVVEKIVVIVERAASLSPLVYLLVTDLHSRSEGSLAAVGDGPGGHRHQVDRLGTAL